MSRLKVSGEIEVQAPLLLLSCEEQFALREQGIRVLQLRVPTLASINRKYSNAGGRFHTNASYLREEKRAQELVAQMVQAMKWVVTKKDTYLLVFDLAFANEYKQDLDGPMKGMLDCLRPSLTRSERRTMPQVAIDLWQQQHPPAIYNDNRIKQIELVKHIHQRDLTSTITIYAFTSPYPYIPVHQLILHYLCQVRNLPLAAKGTHDFHHILRPTGSGSH